MRLATFLAFAGALSISAWVSAEDLVVNGTTVELAGRKTYDHVCVINGGTVRVAAYTGDKATGGNLELVASSVYIDGSSRIDARGKGYVTRKCYHGEGPTLTAGGRGGCAVMDSGGGGAHFGRGGRGTVDDPTTFDTHFEDNCDVCDSNGQNCSHFWDTSISGTHKCKQAQTGTATPKDPSLTGCGMDYLPPGAIDTSPKNGCPDKPDGDTGRYCKLGPSVAGLPFWHNIYQPEFGAAGGDKGCRDNDGYDLITGGSGGGRVVLVGLKDRLASGGENMAPASCGGVRLTAGNVRIDGTIDAGGKRGCGTGNDSGGGGAGGTVLVVGDNVEIKQSARISAAGGLGGDTHSAFPGAPGMDAAPDYQDCAGAQSTGTCDDCGGGGGGGIISVLSVKRNLEAGPLSQFNVSGALGGTCDVCKGEAGGGAGELQLDGAYVGEFCDGFDNDFDGMVDEGLGTQRCGLGSCREDIAACENGVPNSCDPDVSKDLSCRAPAESVRPRVAVIVDTSASMLLNLAGYPTFGDGSQEHPGIASAGDSRLRLAREALGQVISAYPEIEFALARYHQDQGTKRSCQTATWFECQKIVASYDDPTDNTGADSCKVNISASQQVDVKQVPGAAADSDTECINYAGSCGSPRRGADILSGFDSEVRDIVRWLDGRETAFSEDTTPGDVCKHSEGKDCELRGSGPTPLAGSLQAIEDYISPIRKEDAAVSCRDYEVILVTDGAESCNEDPVAAAADLKQRGINVNVVAVSVLPEERASLDAIAAAGGTSSAIFVSQPGELVPALTGIIAGAIRSEACNGKDDDCDGRIDEDFPGLDSDCDDGKEGVCRGTGKNVCNAAQDGVECQIKQAGQPPSPEVCNDVDDDCDLSIDEGLHCETMDCTPKGAELCNGEDDDCDGKVDESDPALGRECGENRGACRPGNTRCIAGTLQCIGDIGPMMEQCNGIDDDCDGEVDNMAPCPDPTACIEGACRSPCGGLEFSCPVGLLCRFAAVQEKDYCLPGACALCRSTEKCVNDVCVDPCDGVTCEEGLFCVRGDCRDCTFAGCPDDLVCYQGLCQPDACAGKRCARGEFCFNGECKKQCDDLACSSGQSCNDVGLCEANVCAGMECAGALICRDGVCGADPCANADCPVGQLCVAGMGCVDDPCGVTWCPANTQCKVSASGAPRCITPRSEDASRPRTYVSTSGAKSCSVAQARGSRAGLALLTLLHVLGLLFVRRRRLRRSPLALLRVLGVRRVRRRRLQLSLLVAALLGTSGCEPQAICLDCDPASRGGGVSGPDSGSETDSGSVVLTPSRGTDGGAGGNGSVIVRPTCNGLDEQCNKRDDDCDGLVDEDFDLNTNPRHCGECDHSCLADNADTACSDGQCTLKACLAGFVDLDGTLGCEYHCPVYPPIPEDCNGADDDCDGTVDEELTAPDVGTLCRDTADTPCANVGVVCEKRNEKTTWFCDYWDSVDFDPSVPNGIDTEERRCDGIDNDCDGSIDEPWSDLGESCDDGKIGACRNGGVIVCADDQKSTRCDLSAAPDPLPNAGPDAPELCNGFDDNCDGIVDNSDPMDAHRVVDDMVMVTHNAKTYYIYTYEASRPDASADAAGISGARSCSRAGVKPWSLVSYATAGAACAVSGKRLCTGDEWQWACEASDMRAYPYGTEYDANRCNGADHDISAGGAIDNGVVATGSMGTCKSTLNVFDLSGNVKEWVDQKDMSMSDIFVVRGGSFESPRLGLTCQTALSQSVGSSVLPGLGFRCCSDTAP